MPNPFEMMRLRNMFDPTQSMSADVGGQFNMPPLMGPEQPSPYDQIQFGNTQFNPNAMAAMAPKPQQEDIDPQALMTQLYHPQHQASDILDQLANSYPQRPVVSGKRQLAGAIMGGLGAVGGLTRGPGNWGGEPDYKAGNYAQDEITGENAFNKNVADWKNQIGPIQSAANMERYANTNERQNAYQTIQAALRDRGQENQFNINQEKVDNARRRTEIYDYKTKHPNVKIYAPKGGNVQIMDPATGKMTDTGIATGTLTEMDRLNLQAEDKVEAIDEAARQARITEGVKGDEARKTKAVVPGKAPTDASGKPLTPGQIRVQQHDAARQFAIQHPELAPYIKFGPGQNDFDVTAPGEVPWYSTKKRPTQQQHDDIVAGIYGENIPIAQPTRTGATSTESGVPVNRPNMGTKPLTHGQPAQNAGPNQTQPQGGNQSVKDVPPEKRVVGQTYIMGNGKPGIWSGIGFKAVP
jgi:hypothetical protein